MDGWIFCNIRFWLDHPIVIHSQEVQQSPQVLYVCVLRSNILNSVEKLKGVRMSDLPLRFDWVTFPMMVLQSEARHKQNKGHCRVCARGLGGVCVCVYVSCVQLCYSDYVWQVDSLWHLMALSPDIFWGSGCMLCPSLEGLRHAGHLRATSFNLPI